MVNVILRTNLSWEEAHTLYNRIWIPQILYCLPVTSLTLTQCNQIHSPILNSYLPQIGINRKMARTIIHGPRNRGGLGIPSLYALQIAAQVHCIIATLRGEGSSKALMATTLEYTQLESGIGKPILEADYICGDYITSSYIISAWKGISEYKLKITNTKIIPPQVQREYDSAIMEELIPFYHKSKLKN